MWSFPSYPELDPAPPSFAFNDSGSKEIGHFSFLQLSTGHASPHDVQVDTYSGLLDQNVEELQGHIQNWDASHSRSYPTIPSGSFHVGLLRLLFVEMDVYYQGTGGRFKPPIPTRICNWLNQQFSVPPVFLGHLARGVIGGTGYTANALFRKFDSEGNVKGLEGFFSRTAVWFLHDLQTGASTYVIVDCPLHIRDRILSIATGKNPEKLLQPLFLDVLVVDGIGWSLADLIDNSRDAIVEYELSQNTSVDTSSGIRALHRLSQTWHVISGDLSNLEERLQYLLKLRSEYYAASEVLHENISRKISESGCGIEDSVEFLLARTRGWKRWAENYNERTKIQINLFFNLSTQADNRTNLEIARLTGDIAVDTQKDSSSMITMAAVTMFFLPGTFVSALFSMVFFNIDFGPNGESIFSVSNKLWYFAVVTVPLTLAVFIVWLAWKRQRIAKKDITKGGSILQ
ncbi:hypothetical protein M422DRAFT_782343 [Sphaerobolus stellatus SS14]|uniref:Uncharacterized protein n=1 Tax=Sphaerobolus stellatus (strain SS14) TaxID=990650 RepID=A0A0C9U0A6_SPHS4|nr:hypothetical protein M422DRAFT_782343 [Sphaerobolus stellatus SS14]